jgi:hypothetical protein
MSNRTEARTTHKQNRQILLVERITSTYSERIQNSGLCAKAFLLRPRPPGPRSPKRGPRRFRAEATSYHLLDLALCDASSFSRQAERWARRMEHQCVVLQENFGILIGRQSLPEAVQETRLELA